MFLVCTSSYRIHSFGGIPSKQAGTRTIKVIRQVLRVMEIQSSQSASMQALYDLGIANL